MLRLGGQTFESQQTPEGWVESARSLGYSAVYWPVHVGIDDSALGDYVSAANEAGLMIAEVGVWNNPLAIDGAVRKEAIERCITCLALADKVGASCCVNVAGSRGTGEGPSGIDLIDETFDMVVESVRTIVDAVKPTRTAYTVETLPAALPDSADSYVALLKAVDRKGFAVHFDPVNLVNSPRKFFDTAGLVRDFVGKLGPHIRSVHAKDVVYGGPFPVGLQEVRPGEGQFDYEALLGELSKLDHDVPLMMEHLTEEAQYREGAEYIRGMAGRTGIRV